jgi:hypothetical protein
MFRGFQKCKIIREDRQVLYTVAQASGALCKDNVAVKSFKLERNGGMSVISFNM